MKPNPSANLLWQKRVNQAKALMRPRVKLHKKDLKLLFVLYMIGL